MTASFRILVVAVAALLVGGCAGGYRPPVVRPAIEAPPVLSDAFRVRQDVREVRRVVSSPGRVTKQDEESGPIRVESVIRPVTLQDVVAAVETHFPDLVVARLGIEAAEARLLESEGSFDTTIRSQSKNSVQGYYQYEIFDFEVEQPLREWGTNLRAGYRFGLGDFGSYDGDIETNAGGEFYVGFDFSILKGREIDSRRARIFKAELARDAAHPRVQEKRVALVRKASASYWKAVAAARAVGVAQDLLDLAKARRDSLAESVRLGELPEIILVDNDGLVAQREAYVVAARRKFEQASILLSLYLRDDAGEPRRLTMAELPDFPAVPAVSPTDLEAHVGFGLEYRPELKILEYEVASADVERAKRINDLLPKLDFFALSSQDVGASTSSSAVDDPFELQVGVKFEVPLQRRRARGGLAAAKTKIAQLGEKARLQADEVEVEIRDAASALARARERLELSRKAARLTATLATAEFERLSEGEGDLLRVNVREQTAAKALTDVLKAQAACFIGLADYRAALGLPGPPVDGLP